MRRFSRSSPKSVLRSPRRPDPERRLLLAFGRRLAQLRLERGLSQKAISRELEIGDELMSKYERGLHTPRLGTLVRLRTVLSVSLDFLLAGASADGITDPRFLYWARAASQLSLRHRDHIASSLESLVRTAQAADEREQSAGSRP